MRITPLALLVIGLAVTPRGAFACDCLMPATPQARLEKASTVFSGVVLSSKVSTTPAWTKSYRFRVIQRFKGPVRREYLLEHGDSNCHFPFKVGESYLVYAYGKKPLSANICSSTQALSRAAAEVEALKQIIAGKSINQ